MLAIIFEKQEEAERLVKDQWKGINLFYLLWNKFAVRITPPLNISFRFNKGCNIIIKFWMISIIEFVN